MCYISCSRLDRAVSVVYLHSFVGSEGRPGKINISTTVEPPWATPLAKRTAYTSEHLETSRKRAARKRSVPVSDRQRLDILDGRSGRQND